MLAGRPISDNPCSFGSMILTLITSLSASSWLNGGPDRRVQRAPDNVGDVAEVVRAALVAEGVVLGGHVLRSLDGARRPSGQQPDLGEADLQQPGAEPVLSRAQHGGDQRRRSVLSPAASTLSSTSPGPGSGTGIVTSSGSLCQRSSHTACIVA
jgi:hypothetical protein